MLSSIVAACLASMASMRNTSVIHLANTLTQDVSPPKSGKGNAVAMRMAEKRKRKIVSRKMRNRRR